MEATTDNVMRESLFLRFRQLALHRIQLIRKYDFGIGNSTPKNGKRVAVNILRSRSKKPRSNLMQDKSAFIRRVVYV